MPNIKLILEYDGSKFCGWQYQPNMRTVQGEVERALKILLKEKVGLYVAGRTDAGVHAYGQVANFHTTAPTDVQRMPRQLNGILPHDVVVKNAEMVPAAFHARHDAISRQYFYVLSRHPVAVGRGYAYFCKFPLEVEAMKAAALYFLGEHNFRAFCSSRTEDPHYLSRVEMIQWEERDEKIIMRVRANRFLRNMVRIMAGTLINVGRGALPASEIPIILANQKRVEAGCTAPPHGLFLEKVFYPAAAMDLTTDSFPAPKPQEDIEDSDLALAADLN
jgi:tRNA pseudouridine38-40 synthase